MRTIPKEYKENTLLEVNRMQKVWNMELVPFDEYCEMIKCFDLKLDLDPKGYLHLYYNTGNSWGKWLEASTSPLDKDKISWANVNGSWYKKHVVRRDDLYIRFTEFRQKYFTIYENNYILQI